LKNEFGGIPAIRQNAAHFGRGQENIFRAFDGKKTTDCRFAGQI